MIERCGTQAGLLLRPVVDCFNVLNSHTVLARNGFVGTYDARNTPAFSPKEEQFKQVVETLPGRTVRFGVRVAF